MALLRGFLLLVFLAAPIHSAPVKSASECPVPIGADYHCADDADCGIFYKCDHGQWVQQSCPGGLVFDPSQSICVYDDEYTCPYSGSSCPDCGPEGTCDTASSTCTCNPGWTGTTCETDIDECAQNTDDCADLCTNTGGSYTCSCTAPLTLNTDGKSCDAPSCSPACENGGTCVIDTTTGVSSCQCEPGFTGDSCELFDVCFPINCQNGGTCSIVNNQGVCTCPTGFTGSQCETPVTSDTCATTTLDCLNGGQCSDQNGAPECLCPNGFTGTTCETTVPKGSETCATSGIVCQNDGQCIDSTSGPACFCPNGFTGEFCQDTVGSTTDPCATVTCLNDGVCVDGLCYCPNGFTGDQCEQTVGTTDPCATVTCENNGICSEGTCFCANGFTGTFCEQTVSGGLDACDTSGLTCENGGMCVDMSGTATCVCQDGFSGTNCEVSEGLCSQTNCLNGGTCVESATGELSCDCLAGYTGQFCEREIDCSTVVCLNGGTCGIVENVEACECPTGTSGDHCETRQDCGTDGSPCMNGAECVDSSQGFVCVCTFGWTGLTCETMRTCAGDFITCENGGTCQDTADGADCMCATGFTGDFCELTVDACGGCENGGVCKVPEIFPPSDTTKQSCACPPEFTGEMCELPSDCPIPCSPDIGANGDRSKFLMWPDPSSEKNAIICNQGLLQYVEACPDTSFNFYAATCLTAEEYAAAQAAKFPTP